MTLNVFIDSWTRNKHIVYLCSDKCYDDMFNLIDEINEGKKKIEEINEYLICTFIPSGSQFITAYYLQGKLADAEVEHFYTGDGYMIVWIEESEEV